MNENEIKKRTRIVYRIIIICIFIFVIVLFGVRSNSVIRAQTTKERGVIVKAEIVEIVYSNIEGANEYGGGSGRWDLRYLYIDESGIRYSDVIPLKTSDIAEAEAWIGKKIDIYIDGKGYSLAVDYANKSYTWPIIREAGVCGFCLIGFITYIIIIINRHKSKICKGRAFNA